MIKILYIGNKISKHGYNLTGIETLGPLLESEGFEIVYASDKKSKILRMLDMVVTTFRHRNTVNYVLIDTYSTSNFWFAFIISQLCRVLRIPYIPILRGGNLPSRLKNNTGYCHLIFNNAFTNVAPSGYLYLAFANENFGSVVYIPNTIEIEKYPFTNRPCGSPKLLWVRSLAAIYNPEMAIKVIAKLQRSYPDAVLFMVGPDRENLLPQLKSLAKDIDANVNFTGKLTKQEWTALSNSANIFINTTHFDNMPVSVIEAMALGLPVISTNVGGIPHLLEHRIMALLVDDAAIDQMHDAILELCKDDTLRNSIVYNARKHVTDFDWNNVRHKWLEILK